MEKFHKDYPVYKPRLTDDCDSVLIWNWFREQLQKKDWDIGLLSIRIDYRVEEV